jgi:hypothetical protein
MITTETKMNIHLYVVSLMFIVSFSIFSGSIGANPLARSQGQVKLDADKSKFVFQTCKHFVITQVKKS